LILGMDFGTTNSGIAAYDGQRLQFIPIDPSNQNANIARTAMYITNDREVYIGRQAIDIYYEQNLNRPVKMERVKIGEVELTFAELPSFMKDVYVEKDALSPGRLFLSFKTSLSTSNYIGTVVGSHFYFLEDIIALYVYIAKRRAEQFLDKEIKEVVLGRPVRFSFDPIDDLLARERLLKAAFRAGYEKVYLQYEPIAAAYHYETTIHDEQNILIFDFGGGTLDISILRVGDARSRRVLANGGIPIAGDVFDQKLVRARLPKHFGEDSYYRSGGKQLPVPSSYYEAFSNWQDMLSLQRPDKLEEIERIERTAERPRQIRALRHLISSSYGLKMYDTVETVKRQLSTSPNAAIRLDGKDFDVYEPVTRADFERVIRADVEAVDAYLDEMLRQAGLGTTEIDKVIRTGGSSEIPAFIDLLNRRFGQEKVQSIDIFSSVTSGLGIMAHRLEQGEVEATAYHRRDYDLTDRLESNRQNDIPAVDFESMKKFVALVEPQTEMEAAVGFVGMTDNREVIASIQQPDALDNGVKLGKVGLPTGELVQVLSGAPHDSVLLCTSDYRFLRKTIQQLARLKDVGLDLADAEGFQVDVFGDEYVCGLAQWNMEQAAEIGLLVTISGYYKSFKAEPLMARLEQSVPYQPARLKGDPFSLMTAQNGDQVVTFSANGRAVCVSASVLAQQQEGRLISLSSNDRMIAVLPISREQNFLLASEEGAITVVHSTEIPMTGLNTTGTKVFTPRNLKSVLPWDDDRPVWIVTSERLLLLDPELLESNASTKPRRAVRLAKAESLVGLIAPHL
jgi:hypothetical chaperone protein